MVSENAFGDLLKERELHHELGLTLLFYKQTNTVFTVHKERETLSKMIHINTINYVMHSDFLSLSVLYNSQHLQWIRNVHQSCPKTRTHLCFRKTFMKGFDPLQMLTFIRILFS